MVKKREIHKFTWRMPSVPRLAALAVGILATTGVWAEAVADESGQIPTLSVSFNAKDLTSSGSVTVTGQTSGIDASAYEYGYNGYALNAATFANQVALYAGTANKGGLSGGTSDQNPSPLSISVVAKLGLPGCKKLLYHARVYSDNQGLVVFTSSTGTTLMAGFATSQGSSYGGVNLIKHSTDAAECETAENGKADFTKWHHFVLTADKDTGEVKFYVDGILKTTIAKADFKDGGNNARNIAEKSYSALYLGKSGGVADFNTDPFFSYDDVRFYAATLTASEITALYNAIVASKSVAFNDTQSTFGTMLSSVLASATSGDTVTPILDRVTETSVTIPTGVTLAVDSGADLSGLDITCNGAIKVNVASEPSSSDVLLTTKGNTTSLNVTSDDYFLEGTYDSENAKTTWSATSYTAEGSYIRVWDQDFENSSTVEENWTYAIGNETLEALLKVLKNSSSTQMNHTGYSPARNQKLHLMANGDQSKYLQFYKTGRNGSGNGCWSARYTFPQIFDQTSNYRFEFDWYGVSCVQCDTGYLCLESSDGIVATFGIPASSTTAYFYKMQNEALVQDGTITVDERGTSSESGSHWHHIVIRGDKANDETTIQVTSLSGTEELSTRTLSTFVSLSSIYAYSETDSYGYPADWGFDNFVLKTPKPLGTPDAPTLSIDTTANLTTFSLTASEGTEETATLYYRIGATGDFSTYATTLTLSDSAWVYYYESVAGVTSEVKSEFVYSNLEAVQLAAPTSIQPRGFGRIYVSASQDNIIGKPEPTIFATINNTTYNPVASGSPAYIDYDELSYGSTLSVYAGNTSYATSEALNYTVALLPHTDDWAVKYNLDFVSIYNANPDKSIAVNETISSDVTGTTANYRSLKYNGVDISDGVFYVDDSDTSKYVLNSSGGIIGFCKQNRAATYVLKGLPANALVFICHNNDLTPGELYNLTNASEEFANLHSNEKVYRVTASGDASFKCNALNNWRRQLYGVRVCVPSLVKAGGKGYVTIADAIAAAQAAGSSSVSVSLVASVTEDVTIPAGMTVTITEDTENSYTLIGTVTAADGTTVEASEGIYTYSCPKQWTDTNTLTADTTLDDGAYFANQTLYVPKNAEGYEVTMTITGEGSSLKMYDGVVVANKSGTGAIVIEEGGALTVSGSNNLTIGNADDASGSVTVNAGTLDWSNNTIRLGTASGATGTLTVNEGATVVATHYNVGEVTGATGNLIVTGGSLTAQRINMGGPASSGDNMSTSDHTGTTATYTQSGGTVTVSQSFYICKYLNSSGSATLSGGTLTVPAVEAGYGTGTLLLNGGTLRASANANSFVPSANVTTTIGANGAIIDTQGYTVTIPANLAAAENVETPTLTKKGSGTLTLSAQTEALVIKVEDGSVTVPQTSGCTAGAGTKREESGDNYVFSKGPVIEPNAASATEITAASQEAADAIAETYNVTLTSAQEEQGLEASYYKVVATSKEGSEGTYIISVILDKDEVAPEIDTSSEEPMTVTSSEEVSFAVATTSLKKGLYYGVGTKDTPGGTVTHGNMTLCDGTNEEDINFTAALPDSGVKYYTIEASDTDLTP